MAKYIVTYTGANGIKAYASASRDDLRFTFSFAESEALTWDFDQIDMVTTLRNKEESFFIHDHNAATLPAGLEWKAEKI